ncbi:MAG TPA: hypothetical protein VNJ01_06825 [Bacteriovoracaceae bacterium]|nr:hypothetical protein [Bacteriovoracaceae bacterium]
MVEYVLIMAFAGWLTYQIFYVIGVLLFQKKKRLSKAHESHPLSYPFLFLPCLCAMFLYPLSLLKVSNGRGSPALYFPMVLFAPMMAEAYPYLGPAILFSLFLFFRRNIDGGALLLRTMYGGLIGLVISSLCLLAVYDYGVFSVLVPATILTVTASGAYFARRTF